MASGLCSWSPHTPRPGRLTTRLERSQVNHELARVRWLGLTCPHDAPRQMGATGAASIGMGGNGSNI